MDASKKESDYNMFDWWKKVVFENYGNFEGRARRSEYWYFSLVNLLFLIPIFILIGVLSGGNEDSPLFIGGVLVIVLCAFALIVPGIAVAVRRLHDTGKSGWWYLLGVIPIVSSIGGIVLLVFYLLEGDPGDNEYGPNPKASNSNSFIGQGH